MSEGSERGPVVTQADILAGLRRVGLGKMEAVLAEHGVLRNGRWLSLPKPATSLHPPFDRLRVRSGYAQARAGCACRRWLSLPKPTISLHLPFDTPSTGSGYAVG